MEMLLDCGRINSVPDLSAESSTARTHVHHGRTAFPLQLTHEALYQIRLGVGSSERLAAYSTVLPSTAVLGFWNPNGSNADNNTASHTASQDTHISSISDRSINFR